MSGVLSSLPEGRHAAPARGAVAGARGDHKDTKSGKYDPRNAGTAWSHNFLNQKPWHPSNFKNQARVYEAEQETIALAKRNALAKSEFEAEQYQMENLSYLSPEEREKHKATAQIAFMYQKPPGMDTVEKAAAAKEEAAKSGNGQNPSQGADGQGRGQGRRPPKPPPAGGHVKHMLGAVAALGQADSFELKPGMGGLMGQRSPPRGGHDIDGRNQQFLVTSSDEENPPAVDLEQQARALLKQEKRSRKERKRKEVEAAEAFLRSAGVDPADAALRPSSKRHKKHDKKHKKRHRKDDT
mmetsp:Transcript_587/g.1710  ORF Transcript_587/g.1710 Transcript_587/m.1710 type:complete len:297 (-) Transcript_587:90-980(-)|eukprot:CAMPEP_0206142504 /NCGR_PEP_ID=MMETSP1473-20131121/17160_1 /ASSEMBLY_ACC=CAM_ASM_001109 /TAXON_ID=1461547 /ORGANISM="Stichococcus sp, Strain RCC1054" /LENGTH=296 /DNA_ID=CAMNT_0053537533 /DNA_START=211 /DNA_END=1101 /DNA_ORIENTATION=+